MIEIDTLIILESLPAGEDKTGALLKDALDAEAAWTVNVEYVEVFGRGDFEGALMHIAARVRRDGMLPALHFEFHGNEHRFGFADGSSMFWSDLRAPLIAVNTALRNTLIVTLAACSGAYLGRAITATERAPFRGIVGPRTTIPVKPLVAGFRAFYLELAGSHDFDAAVRALRVGGLTSYDPFGAAELFDQAFGRYVAEQQTTHPAELMAQLSAEQLAVLGENETSRRAAIETRIAETSRRTRDRLRSHFMMEDMD